MFRSLTIVATLIAAVSLSGVALAQSKLTGEQQVRKDKQDFAQNDAWIYDDLDAAIDEAMQE